MDTLYTTLGVVRTAELHELRSAFKRRALCLHPDKGGTKEAFQQVLLAFETLSDATRRARYDRKLAQLSARLPRHNIMSQQHVDRTHSVHPTHRKSKTQLNSSTKNSGDLDAGHASSSGIGSPHNSASGISQKKEKSVPEPSNAATNDTKASTSRKMVKSEASTPPHVSQQASCSGDPWHICLAKLHGALKDVSVSVRRRVLSHDMTEKERRTLESWIHSRACAHGQDAVHKQVPTNVALDVVAYSAGDSSCSCSSSSSYCCSSEEEDKSSCESSCGDMEEAQAICWYGDDVFKDSQGTMSLMEAGQAANMDCESVPPMPHTTEEHTENLSGAACNLDTSGQQASASAKGIARHVMRGVTRYSATLCFNRLIITSRTVLELSAALDYLVVIMTIKARASSLLEAGCSFQDSIRTAVPAALQEHRAIIKGLGLHYFMSISSSWWLGKELCTPKMKDLETALKAWAALDPFILQGGRRSLNTLAVFVRKGEEDWQAFRSAWLSMAEDAGHETHAWAERLDASHAAAEPKRRHVIASWNRIAMAREERIQRCSERLARKLERMNGRAMAKEDRRSLHPDVPEQKRTTKNEQRAERTISQCLRKWRRLEEVRSLRMTARRKRSEALKRRSIRIQEAERKRSERQRKLEKDQLWRRMNQKDVTMNELMAGFR